MTTATKVAIVLGSACCLEADAATAFEMFRPSAIVAAGNSALIYKGRLHAATGTAAERAGRVDLYSWRGEISKRGVKSRYVEVGRNTGDHAVLVSLLLYGDKVILAGMPESPELGHVGGTQHAGYTSRGRLQRWSDRLAFLGDRVRSLSGQTMAVLGRPDREWLTSPAASIDLNPPFLRYWLPDGRYLSDEGATLNNAVAEAKGGFILIEANPLSVEFSLGEPVDLVYKGSLFDSHLRIVTSVTLMLLGQIERNLDYKRFADDVARAINKAPPILKRSLATGRFTLEVRC